MLSDVEEVLVPAEAIQERVKAMGGEISRDYRGQAVVCVGVLKGCVVFLGDLLKHLSVQARVEFIGMRSYRNEHNTGVVDVYFGMAAHAVEGRHVLIVEDMIDTGGSMRCLHTYLAALRPASLRTAVMFSKSLPQARDVPVDYTGFTIGNRFVVGYGTDYNEWYRNLPFLAVLTPAAQAAHAIKGHQEETHDARRGTG
eukprot:TRINITY_DN5465_c1_g1_i2.p2 TRINITY_DN5465_c1_g1~~TRINITY_DN5465_c1_g1_i2.p2  ORF type:complete len:198 (+),score=69.42 TRINITY_DN5465_c1_g1_i2:51-644(+)